MTDIATKGGAVIFKDGAAAENCNCCGGWVCCVDKCNLAEPSSVTVTIVAEDFYTQYGMTDNFGLFESSVCVFGSAINGTHSLTRTTTKRLFRSSWKKVFTATPPGCTPTELELNLSYDSRFVVDFELIYFVPAFYYAHPTNTITKEQMSCGIAPTPPFEKAYQQNQPGGSAATWPLCAELPYTLLHETGGSNDVFRLRYARRGGDTAYGAGVLAARQVVGSDKISITVALR
jgi:hypothetical protein